MILTAHDAARDLIERYVRRGDSLQMLRASRLYRGCNEYRAGIGSCCGGECFSADWIVVIRLAPKKPRCERVHLPRLYAEIVAEMRGIERQAPLL